MKLEQLPTDKLIPYARNSRTHSEEQVRQIADSITEFGFTNPVLVDANGTIVAGHGRVMAAKLLQMEKVPCIRLGHLNAAQIRAYVIADNKLALNAGWDDQMLREELEALREEGFEAKITGFTDAEIDALLAGGSSSGMDAAEPPDDFKEADENIETDHQCPKCGYKWSGGK